MTLPSHAAVKQFWPTSLYAFAWQEHADEAAGIISYLYQLRDEQETNIASGIAPGAKSQEGLFESDFDLLDRPNEGIQKLKAFIQQSIKEAVIHANRSTLDPSQLNVQIADSWYHITNSGGFHDSHFHGHCSWCGIYYLRIGDSGERKNSGAPNGGNRFYSPLWRGGNFQDFGNTYLSETSVDPPISDGMLLLFPSYLMHSGLPYEGTEDRIVISVNSRTAPTSKK